MTQPPPPPSPGGHPPDHAQRGYGAPERKPSRAPKVLIILGTVIFLLSVIIGVILAFVGIGGAMSSLEELEVLDSGNGTVTAEAGEVLQIYVEEGTPAPVCTVEGPSEGAVGPGSLQSSTMSDGATAWRSVESFTANEAGQYSIDCGDTPVGIAPPVSITGIFTGVGGIFLAIGGGAIGFLLVAVGVILLLVRRSRA